MKLFSKCRTLKDLIVLSWIVPGVFAFIASLLMFALLAWLDFDNSRDAAIQSAIKNTELISRRVSAEVLLGKNGRAAEVMDSLQKDIGVEKIWQVSSFPDCDKSLASNACIQISGKFITVYQKASHVKNPTWIAVQTTINSVSSYFNWMLFGWSAVPIFIAMGLGLYFQQKIIATQVTEPIRSLVAVAESRGKIPPTWPVEIQTIAKALGESFQAREDAVFAMLAKGVIHDIKTWVHSLMTATELANEINSSATDQRVARMEKLLKACNIQLPKIRITIERALEGGRDIQADSQEHNIVQTIEQSLQATAAIANEHGVKVTAQGEASFIMTQHDPIHLERALSNLVKNAIESAGTSSQIGAIKSVIVAARDRNDFIDIKIEDSGHGLPDGFHDLFKPTRSTKKDGAGLGLYIANKIIRGHRGTITTNRSTELGGASFTVSLPKTQESNNGGLC